MVKISGGQFANLGKICFVQFPVLTPTSVSVTTTLNPHHSQHDQCSEKENLLQWNRGIIFVTG